MQAPQVERVRRFNRFYTRQLGLLQDGILDSPFTLTEARVLYEVAHREPTTARALQDALGLDRGHLSRLLGRFERRRLVRRTPGKEDRRERALSLTAAGRAAFGRIDAASRDDVAAMLARLREDDRARLLRSMDDIERALDAPRGPERSVVLREPKPGDLGWVVQRHGALYAQEHGWNAEFEALVARIVADFGAKHDPARERCWIAEVDGERAGCVFLVAASADVAKLRLLLVEPDARGMGLGKRLVDECVRFAREAGYRTLTLWTNDVLVAARRIYERAGFRRVKTGAHRSFGHDLVEETWELAL